jgi:AP-3 complex subunit delta
VLSCLGNICNKELGQELLQPVLNAISHTKPLIRKKALATLRTIFEGNPSVISGCMDKIAARLQEEQEPNVLSTCISICNTVLNLQPQLHPVLIKPLFGLFEGRRSNWVQIKLVKLV